MMQHFTGKRLAWLTVFALLIVFKAGIINAYGAGLSKADRENLTKSLSEAAQRFGEAYVKRDFKTMYKMLNKEYRHRVELWEYKDSVHYDGISDGFMQVNIMEVVVLPSSSS